MMHTCYIFRGFYLGLMEDLDSVWNRNSDHSECFEEYLENHPLLLDPYETNTGAKLEYLFNGSPGDSGSEVFIAVIDTVQSSDMPSRSPVNLEEMLVHTNTDKDLEHLALIKSFLEDLRKENVHIELPTELEWYMIASM